MSAWLVVVDPQRVFADPGSPWGSPMFGAIVGPVRKLAAQHRGRVVVTRWVPPAEPLGSWRTYLDAWPFADRPGTDPLFEVVPELGDVADHVVSAPTFGKWAALETLTGPAPELVLTGVSTDCCVLSTALAAADAGATVQVVARACAGSSPQDHAAALHLMGLYAPQVSIV